jgi:hypothetical protein
MKTGKKKLQNESESAAARKPKERILKLVLDCGAFISISV